MSRLPDYRTIPGWWNGYVEAGSTRAERARRLAECPAEFRAGVASHVQTAFAVRAQQRQMQDDAA